MFHEKRFAEVLGRRMAYVEVGAGDPIVFLHGNPTSSYLWRTVIPEVAGLGRCLAPDLIGMGDSDKLPGTGPGSYRFVEHRRHLDALLDALDVRERVTLVVHDWGSALGFDWANRHRTAIRAIAYMEALVRPLSWAEWPQAGQQIFRALRSPAGEEMVLEKNVFVERLLPASVLRPLDESTMVAYRAPFVEPGEGRRPTLTWPREIPFDGEPADVHDIIADYAAWLPDAPFPKLFIDADPGFVLTGAPRDFARTWANQTEVRVAGSHFVQEDSGPQIGAAIAAWLQSSAAAGR